MQQLQQSAVSRLFLSESRLMEPAETSDHQVVQMDLSESITETRCYLLL